MLRANGNFSSSRPMCSGTEAKSSILETISAGIGWGLSSGPSACAFGVMEKKAGIREAELGSGNAKRFSIIPRCSAWTTSVLDENGVQRAETQDEPRDDSSMFVYFTVA